MFKGITLFAISGLILLSSQVYGQEIQLNNGKSTVLIELNNGDQNQDRRIRRLERAVRDLQDQVWQLSSGSSSQKLYVCKVTAFMTTFTSAKHNLEYDAKEDALARCKKENSEMHCADVTCEKIN